MNLSYLKFIKNQIFIIFFKFYELKYTFESILCIKVIFYVLSNLK